MTWQCVMYEQVGWHDYEDRGGRYMVFRGPDGAECTFKTLPFGAMFYDDHCQWTKGCKRPDGRCLVVKVPGRDGAGNVRGYLWPIDHPPSGDGPGWTRTGTPPNVTATPSINYAMGELGYHGWLTAGVLTDDVEGRTY